MALTKRPETELEGVDLKALRLSLGVKRIDRIENIRWTTKVGIFEFCFRIRNQNDLIHCLLPFPFGGISEKSLLDYNGTEIKRHYFEKG